MVNGMTKAMRIADESDSKAIPKRMNFTVEALQRLTCPAGKDRIYVYDIKVPGLAHMLSAKGARAFYLLRKIAGRTERIRLGGAEITIETARKAAAKHNNDIAAGANPLAAKRAVKTSETLQELFDRWIAGQEAGWARSKTVTNEKSRFNTCCESIVNRRVLSISQNDIRALHQRVGREHGHVSANRAVQLLRRLFNFARIEPNPVRDGTVDFFPEQTRERFLNREELGRLFKALDDKTVNPEIADFLRVALFTGQRKSNVAAMNAEHIDLINRVWTIPQSEAKAKKFIRVHLSEPAFQIIQRRIGHPSGWIFPSRGKTGHIIEPKSTWGKIRDLAGVTDVTIHDLRRTMASFQAAAGTSLSIIGKSLGHASTQSTAIYARLDLQAVRASVDAAAEAMLATEEDPKE